MNKLLAFYVQIKFEELKSKYGSWLSSVWKLLKTSKPYNNKRLLVATKNDFISNGLNSSTQLSLIYLTKLLDMVHVCARSSKWW